MRRWRRAALPLLVFVLAAVVLGACGGDDDGGDGDAPTAGPDEPASVNLANATFAGAAGAPIAQEQGFFEEENLDVTIKTVELPNIVPSVINGENQFGIASAGGLLQAAEQNIPIKIVAPAYYGTPGEQGVYVGADNNKIQDITDLEGKRIATGTLESVAHAGMLKALEEAGVNPDDVEVISFTFPDIPAALRAGNLQSGHMAEPLITASGDSVREVIDNIYPYGEDPAVTYWFTSEQYANSNPDVVARFQTAVNEAQDLAAEDDSVAREAIAGYTEIEPAVLEEMALPGFGSDPKLDQLQEQADVMVEYGFLEEAPDVDTLFVETE